MTTYISSVSAISSAPLIGMELIINWTRNILFNAINVLEKTLLSFNVSPLSFFYKIDSSRSCQCMAEALLFVVEKSSHAYGQKYKKTTLIP